MAGDVRARPRCGGGGSRLPQRAARRPALQAARLRAGRVLPAAPRHREDRRHDRDPLGLAAGRGRRRRAGRPPPRPRGCRRHACGGALRAGVRGLLRRLHARDPARARRPSPLAGVQPVPSPRRPGHPARGTRLQPADRRGRGATRRMEPRGRRSRETGLAARPRVQRIGAVLRHPEELRRGRGPSPGAGGGARRVRAVRGHRPHRGVRRGDVQGRLRLRRVWPGPVRPGLGRG